MATVREIAILSGVSPSTVSRVINGNVPVSESARNKVLSAINRLQLQEHRGSSISSNCTVGIIMPAISAVNLASHPSLYAVISSFIEVLSQKNVGNTMIVFDEKTNDLSSITSHPLDGYLILGTSERQEDEIVSHLRKLDIPYFLVNRSVGDKHVNCVNQDDEQASLIAVEYLLSLGHTEIAFIGGNYDYRNTKLRYAGYTAALKNAGIEPNPDYVLYGDYSEQSGYRLGGEVLEMNPRPTAAYIASDPIAIGCMRYLTEHGLCLPGDFSIVGFGNIEACLYVKPALTTISQPSSEIGRVAAVALLQMIEIQSIYHQELLLKTSLIIRDSCAPRPAS